MWTFGKTSQWVRLESSPCWGMAEDKFEKDLECHIQKFGIKFEGSEGSQKAFGYKKHRPKNSYGIFFHSMGHFTISNRLESRR